MTDSEEENERWGERFQEIGESSSEREEEPVEDIDLWKISTSLISIAKQLYNLNHKEEKKKGEFEERKE